MCVPFVLAISLLGIGSKDTLAKAKDAPAKPSRLGPPHCEHLKGHGEGRFAQEGRRGSLTVLTNGLQGMASSERIKLDKICAMHYHLPERERGCTRVHFFFN